MRTLLRPTAFVDSPFGHDGKVARLAGGLNWFAAVELLSVDGNQRVSTELVPVEGIESQFDDDMAAQWQALTAPRRAAAAGRAHDPPRPAAGHGHRQRDARQLLRRRPVRRCRGRRRSRRGHGGGGRGDHRCRRRIDPARAPSRYGKATRSTRIVPVIRQLAAGGAAVSVDTRKADVMTAALEAGARMINDVSALTFDDRSAEVIAAAGVPVVLMHHQGEPETMQEDPRYDDVLVEVYLWLEERIAAAEAAGIERDTILVDPGFGFGKNVAPQSRADERPCAVPLARLPDRRRRQPQAHHRRAVGRSAGRPAPRRKHRVCAEGRRAGRADRPRPRCVRNGAGAEGLARPARPGADAARV